MSAMLALIQQDLAKLGIQLNVVVLDFPSLIERISRSFNYESVLMAFVNVDLDPSDQMNIWLSSGANHQWNPDQEDSRDAVGGGDRQTDAGAERGPGRPTTESRPSTRCSRLLRTRRRCCFW